MAHLYFYGGALSVTGSNYLIQTEHSKVLVDCGLIQGSVHCPDSNFEPFQYKPSDIDAVLSTHAHIDHIGRIPRLERDGFKGKIFATKPTQELAPILLMDSQEILANECKGKHPPLYSPADVEKCVKRFVPVEYNEIIEVTKDIRVQYRDAGHILGSASIEVWVSEGDKKTKIVFSGDIGNPPTPLLAPIDYIQDADFVLMETTYGNRLHEDKTERLNIIERIIENTINKNGVLLVPAFAIERTQEILFELNNLVENKKIPRIEIFLDSPLAIKATQVYKHSNGFFNRNATDLIVHGDDIFDFPHLTFTPTTEESKAINETDPPKMIIAGSGMSNGGRILHHEKRYLQDPNNTILFVGYQAPGTLGRAILDGASEVKILGDTIPVHAKSEFIDSYSAHADRDGLLKWVQNIHNGGNLKKVFCVQGEEMAAIAFSQLVKEQLGVEAIVPQPNDAFEF